MEKQSKSIIKSNNMTARFFVDHGDYPRTKDASEIYVRCEVDGELYDICQMSDECNDPLLFAMIMRDSLQQNRIARSDFWFTSKA